MLDGIPAGGREKARISAQSSNSIFVPTVQNSWTGTERHDFWVHGIGLPLLNSLPRDVPRSKFGHLRLLNSN